MDRGNLLLVHGAWCWEHVIPELESSGWRTSVVDLPSASGSPSHGVPEDAAVVREALAALEGPVTVLAHSYGGVPVAEAAGDVDRLVYLAAQMLEPGESLVSPLGGPWYEPGTALLDVPPGDALFADVPDDLARWAVERLRPQSAKSFEDRVTAAAWQTVPTGVILCRDDAIFPPLYAERAAKTGKVRHLAGSHSPFLSRPVELAELVCEISEELPARRR